MILRLRMLVQNVSRETFGFSPTNFKYDEYGERLPHTSQRSFFTKLKITSIGLVTVYV